MVILEATNWHFPLWRLLQLLPDLASRSTEAQRSGNQQAQRGRRKVYITTDWASQAKPSHVIHDGAGARREFTAAAPPAAAAAMLCVHVVDCA